MNPNKVWVFRAASELHSSEFRKLQAAHALTGFLPIALIPQLPLSTFHQSATCRSSPCDIATGTIRSPHGIE
jgi:hypothetical protein